MKRTLAVITFALFAATGLTSPSIAAENTVAGMGTFEGASNHITTGGVSIIKTAGGGAVVILDADFSLDGAPDPHVGFGTDGTYAEASDIGMLSSNSGLQVFVVPASVNVDDFNEVYIWCSDVGVPLGVAAIN